MGQRVKDVSKPKPVGGSLVNTKSFNGLARSNDFDASSFHCFEHQKR